MSISVVAAIAGLTKLAEAIGAAVQAGKKEITEDQLDGALDELDSGDAELTDAIARAKARRLAREAGGGD